MLFTNAPNVVIINKGERRNLHVTPLKVRIMGFIEDVKLYGLHKANENIEIKRLKMRERQLKWDTEEEVLRCMPSSQSAFEIRQRREVEKWKCKYDIYSGLEYCLTHECYHQ